jgi:hypothetical protein
MMNQTKHKLMVYPATYQIIVPGHLDKNWVEWSDRMTITAGCQSDGQPVTTLTGTIDQAALQGLLRRLYALGLPLISVTWLEEETTSAEPTTMNEIS